MGGISKGIKKGSAILKAAPKKPKGKALAKIKEVKGKMKSATPAAPKPVPKAAAPVKKPPAIKEKEVLDLINKLKK